MQYVLTRTNDYRIGIERVKGWSLIVLTLHSCAKCSLIVLLFIKEHVITTSTVLAVYKQHLSLSHVPSTYRCVNGYQ